MLFLLLIVLLISRVAPVAAAVLNATSPDTTLGWVTASGGRGTIDILWSCLSTIFLCAWTVLHFDVPEPGKKTSSVVADKLQSALIVLLAPELLVVSAVQDLLEAKNNVLLLKRVGLEDCTLAHGFFLAMGGFYLRLPEASGSDDRYRMIKYGDLAFLADQGDMNGFTGHYDPVKQRHVEVETAISISQMPWINELRDVTKDRIDNCAKADPLTKIIGCTQALWILTQVLSRWSQGLAVTLLEIDTIAYVIFAVVAYVLWLQKPQDCSQPIVFDCSLPDLKVLRLQGVEYDVEYMGNSAIGFVLPAYNSLWRIRLLCLPIIFGAIKLAVWNLAFPTKLEVWLWRASALFCTLAPLLFACIYIIGKIWEYFEDEIIDWLTPPVFALYACVRLYMIVELFLSLRMVPSSVYQTVEWSSFIPHI
ncbi:hypothetical protein MMC17_002212 [Xylographa soralifera]|nr:hypothetical protein [Xylographa soralifera]